MNGRIAVTVVVSIVALALGGCSAPSGGVSEDARIVLPPTGGTLDYQLGGSYLPPQGTQIVARDRTAESADGVYGICYVNAFQTQPGEADRWPAVLLLRDASGEQIIDPDWPNEILLDTRASADQDELVSRVGGWVDECASAGFDAVEFDNLDSYTRSGGLLTREDAITVARRLVDRAHDRGLAAAQKNAADAAQSFHDDAHFDFAVTEECAQFQECDAYTETYGAAVIGIEYADAQEVPFAAACAAEDRPASLVLRDRDLVGTGDPAYVYQRCPAT